MYNNSYSISEFQFIYNVARCLQSTYLRMHYRQILVYKNNTKTRLVGYFFTVSDDTVDTLEMCIFIKNKELHKAFL